MKKILLALSLLVSGLLISCSVLADAKTVLKERLDKMEGFYAQFVQTVRTDDKQLIQECSGELWFNRPNYINWQINQPDKTTIVADGKAIWIYMPEVEQVIVMSLDQVIDNQLLLLITDSHSEIWQNYQIERTQNRFSLKPAYNSEQSYIIGVLPTGMITDFTIIEADGQQSVYELSHQHLAKVNPKQFSFTVPHGVMVDDQR